MKALLVFALLLIITFLGSLRLFRQYKSRFFLTYLIHSGTFFLVFGILVGQNGLKLISQNFLNQLDPLIHFGLGWAGFMFGFQLEKRYLRWVPGFYFSTTILLFLFPAIIMILVIMPFASESLRFSNPSSTLTFLISISPALILSESSTSFVFWANRRYRLQDRNIRLVSFVAAIDNLFPVILSALLLCSLHSSVQSSQFFLMFVIQLAIGYCAGWGIHFMVKNVQDTLDVSTILFGIIFLLAGTAYLFKLSALFISMIAGATFTNLTRRHSWFQKRLCGIEKPLYLVFMIALPLYSASFTKTVFILAIAVVSVKWISKIGVLLIAPFPERKTSSFAFLSSFLFLPMGSIGPAVLLEMRQFFSSPRIMEITGIFVLAMILAEIIGPAGLAAFNKGNRK